MTPEKSRWAGPMSPSSGPTSSSWPTREDVTRVALDVTHLAGGAFIFTGPILPNMTRAAQVGDRGL